MVVKQDIIFMKKDYGLLLIAVEEDRIAGRNGCTLDGPDMYLDNVITEVSRMAGGNIALLFLTGQNKYWKHI